MARHRQNRYLVLRTKSEKEKCGLPCGVVDAYQANFAGLDHANLATAARVPFETTGLDFSEDASRLHPIRFPAAVQSKLGANHSFVELELRDEDSLHLQGNIERLTSSENAFLQLSKEYTDFHFEPDHQKAAAAVKRQSGGKPSKAVLGHAGCLQPGQLLLCSHLARMLCLNMPVCSFSASWDTSHTAAVLPK